MLSFIIKKERHDLTHNQTKTGKRIKLFLIGKILKYSVHHKTKLNIARLKSIFIKLIQMTVKHSKASVYVVEELCSFRRHFKEPMRPKKNSNSCLNLNLKLLSLDLSSVVTDRM